MNRHRYEAVPQRSNSISSSQNRPYDPSILSPVPLSNPSRNYNFNTGLPSSASSLIDTPSTSNTPTPAYPGTSTNTPSNFHSTPSHTTGPYAASLHSIPTSPPPSFHTHSRSGTPRARSVRTGTSVVSGSTGSGVAGPYGELWGVADSTVGGRDATSNDALATIAGLKQRVEWLEESIGRLLLEKEERQSNVDGGEINKGKHNCCVSFTDADPELERMILRTQSNCCVAFKRDSSSKRLHGREKLLVLGMVGMLVFILLIVMMSTKSRVQGTGEYIINAKTGHENGSS